MVGKNREGAASSRFAWNMDRAQSMKPILGGKAKPHQEKKNWYWEVLKKPAGREDLRIIVLDKLVEGKGKIVYLLWGQKKVCYGKNT